MMKGTVILLSILFLFFNKALGQTSVSIHNDTLTTQTFLTCNACDTATVIHHYNEVPITATRQSNYIPYLYSSTYIIGIDSGNIHIKTYVNGLLADTVSIKIKSHRSLNSQGPAEFPGTPDNPEPEDDTENPPPSPPTNPVPVPSTPPPPPLPTLPPSSPDEEPLSCTPPPKPNVNTIDLRIDYEGCQAMVSITNLAAIQGNGVIWYWQNSQTGALQDHIATNSFLITRNGNYYLRALKDRCWGDITSIHIFLDNYYNLNGGTLDDVFIYPNQPYSLNLKNYEGDIVRWKYRIRGSTIWQTINYKGNKLQNHLINSTENSQYRVLLSNGCSELYSPTAHVNRYTISINQPTQGTQLCLGNPITLSAHTTDNQATIRWYELNTPEIIGTGNAITFIPYKTGTITYKAVATGVAGYSVEDEIAITVQSLPSKPNRPILEPQSDLSYNVSRNNPPIQDITYFWQNSPFGKDESRTQKTIFNAPEGTYYIRGKSINGCWGPISEGINVVDHQTKIYHYTDTNTNYVRTYTFRVPSTAFNLTEPDQLTPYKVTVATDYIDGLGRTIQQVVKQGSPNKKDLVQPIEYDHLGRIAHQHLPYVDNSTNGKVKNNPIAQQRNFYKKPLNTIGNPFLFPFSFTNYEPSPLNRIISHYKQGKPWVGTKVHGTNYERRTNNLTEDGPITIWKPNTTNWRNLENTGTYPEGTLHVTMITNENEHRQYEYKDKLGRLIMIRAQVNKEDYVTTHYLYDHRGNITYILPPEAVKKVRSTGNTYNLAYVYTYDNRNRVIGKKIAGNDFFTPFIYDALDRVVLTQNQGQKKNHQWQFFKYDDLDRVAMTGIFTDPQQRTREQLQEIINDNSYISVINELTYDQKEQVYRYRDDNFPDLQHCQLLKVYYYDNYRFTNKSYDTTYHQYLKPIDYPQENYNHRVRGQLTGTNLRIFHTNKWLENVFFYDDQYRLIQSQAIDQWGMLNIITNRYNFIGELTSNHLHHKANEELHITQYFQYDHSGRILSCKQKINDLPWEYLKNNQYNLLGQLWKKKVGRNPSSPLQELIYRYNKQGWLKTINNPHDVLHQHKLFGYAISYGTYTNIDNVFTSHNAYYNGNIKQTICRNEEGIKRFYTYNYDGLNRITQADYWNTSQPTEDFDVDSITYDMDGNLLSLNRKGLTQIDTAGNKTYGTIDSLSYFYNTHNNKLTAVSDKAGLTGIANDFKDGKDNSQKATAGEYHYDPDGNMISDVNKGIRDIIYNHLNLPEKITMNSGDTIIYLYDADGTKLQMILKGKDGRRKVVDYIGDRVYVDSILQFISNEEGRVITKEALDDSLETRNFVYEYHYRDHLGNLRVAYREKVIAAALATMEEGNEAQEQAHGFTHLATRNNEQAYNGIHSSKPQNNRGVTYRGKVKPGDKLNAAVFIREEPPSSSHSTLPPLSVNIQNTLVRQGIENGNVLGNLGLMLTYHLRNLNKRNSNGNYSLRIQVYNAANVLINETAVNTIYELGTWDLLQKENYIMPQGADSVEVFVVNNSTQEVWFDNLNVLIRGVRIVQENHYYPFGMNMVGIEKQGNPDHQYQYNGKEKQEDFNLHWYDYGARFYDPQLGRWHTIDPLAEDYPSWTPYNYTLNSPINFIDPNGMAPMNSGKDMENPWGDPTTKPANFNTFTNFPDFEQNMNWGGSFQYGNQSNTYDGTTLNGNGFSITINHRGLNTTDLVNIARNLGSQDCPICPFLAGAVTGAALDYGIQVGINLYKGEGPSSFINVDGKSIVLAGGIGMLGGGLAPNAIKLFRLINAGKGSKSFIQFSSTINRSRAGQRTFKFQTRFPKSNLNIRLDRGFLSPHKNTRSNYLGKPYNGFNTHINIQRPGSFNHHFPLNPLKWKYYKIFKK